MIREQLTKNQEDNAEEKTWLKQWIEKENADIHCTSIP